MGAVYDACQSLLAEWRVRYAGRPDREMARLLLLALEREEIVSVGYREAVMLARLRAMDLPDEVRRIIRQAMVWTWKDEEMHAVFTRGTILRLGEPLLKGRAFFHQFSGIVGGWCAAVRQHVRWADAPVSRALAGAVYAAGVVGGQIPRDVRDHLRYRPFRDFCLFNVDAERTALLCWERLTELAAVVPGLPDGVVTEFARIAADEERHGRIFQFIADALGPDDRLVPGMTADRLREQVATVGPFFLTRECRSTADHPLGAGGEVHVGQGQPTDDKRAVFRRTLESANLRGRLERRAADLGKPVGEMRVAVKPTIMMGYSRRDLSPVTDPDLLDELARYLRGCGVADVAAVEARNLYDGFYGNRSVADVARYFGFVSDAYRVVDLSDEQVSHTYDRGMGQTTVGRTWRDADFRISFAKMRTHPVNLVYLTLGNFEGAGSRGEEFIFVERRAHRPAAVMMLLDEFPPDFALLDAYRNVPDGIAGVMGCVRPRHPLRVYAAADAVALDQVASRHMGLRDPNQCAITQAACHWFGDPAERTQVVGTDAPIRPWRGPWTDDWLTLLSFLAYPVYEFGSGRGALFVPEFDKEAFPPLKPETALLRAGREATRRLLGLRHSNRWKGIG